MVTANIRRIQPVFKRRAQVNQILMGKGERLVHLLAKYGNRHGLIAGATGTGKTISLMVLAASRALACRCSWLT